jgi:hypothetical protein
MSIVTCGGKDRVVMGGKGDEHRVKGE